MSGNNESEKTFKINDRRRFDDSGNERGAEKVATKIEEPVETANNNFSFHEPESEYQINFPSFIASLATQSLILLGEMPAPEGMNAPIDPEAAKQTIDIIAMLRDKTAGNLDPDEQQFLDEMLHNLRIAYLRHR